MLICPQCEPVLNTNLSTVCVVQTCAHYKLKERCQLHCRFFVWKEVIGHITVLANNLLLAGTVLANKLLLAGTVPANKFLLAETPKRLKF